MAATLRIFGLVAVLLPATLFCVQNWSRTSHVSFDWGFGAVRTVVPMPLPELLGVAFALGLGVGLIAMLRERARANRRVAELEVRLARHAEEHP